MRRFKRIALIVAASLAGLALALVIAGIIIVQTQWFRDFVRTKIVSAVEDATGGKAEIGSFSFDWRHLRAQIRDFTIHGLEPSNSRPLLHANLVQVDLKLLSPFRGFVDIAYLLLDTPQANVIVFADGHTNIPSPKIAPKHTDKTGLETIVDLAIGHFDLRNGSFFFGNQQSHLDASGANFRAQLGYNALAPSYTGQIDISPLHLRSGGNAPLDVNIQIPITAHKDQIQVANAQFVTPQSHIVVSGEMTHLMAPQTSAHVNAVVALDEANRAAGLNLPLDLTRGPRVLTADVTASIDSQRIVLQSARLALGRSDIEASGTLKESNGHAGATLNASLDLGQLGTLLRVSARPQGTVKLGGTAALDGNNNYSFAGNISGRQVALRAGATRISNVAFDSGVAADPRRIALSNLRLNALGGGFAGNASLENLADFEVAGRLQDFNIETIARVALNRQLGYNGIVSGPVEAKGSVKNIGALSARANLAIAPARARANEIPVSGRLNADYDGRAETATLRTSYIALPHTRLDLSGQLGRQIEVKLVSRNFADFAPLAQIPISLSAGGAATLNASVTGKLTAPRISGAILMTNFAAQGRPFSRFSTDIAASPSNIALTNALVARGTLQMQLTASAGLTDWKPLPSNSLQVDAAIRNADVKDVLALAGESSVPVSGAFAMAAHIGGTIGSPSGTVDASATNGTIDGEKYDAFNLQARMTPGAIDVPTVTLTAGAARIAANATFQHPVNDLNQGAITAHVAANQVQLAQFQSLVKDRPGLAGAITLNGDAAGSLHAGQFNLSTLNANLSAHNLAMQGKALGDVTATANSAGPDVRYNVTSNLAGSTIRVDGQSAIAGAHRTSASASIANLPIDRVAAIAGESDLRVKGTLNATAQVSGTLQDPQGSGTFTVVNGNAYDIPFSRLETSLNYTTRSIDVPRFRLEQGASYIDADLTFTHPPGDLANGDARVRVNSNQIQLATLPPVHNSQPGLSGTVQLTANAVGRLRKNAEPLFSTLNANLRATGISLNKQNLGDLTATASTSGNAVQFDLTSDLAKSNIKGSGTMQLANGYPLNARLAFSNVTYRGLAPLVSAAPEQPFDAIADGSVTVDGSISNLAAINGSVEFTKLEAHSAATSTIGAKPRVQMSLSNSGNIVAAINRGTVTIQNFHLTGHDADFALTGTASLAGTRALALRASGNVNLELLEAFGPEIYSSGSVTLGANIGGTAASPDVTGRIQLQKASFNMLSLPNGLSNTTGTIAFTGSEALIQNVTGQSGGGKVTISGVVAYGGPQMQFHVQATANRVHIEYPPTITTTANASLALNGTSTSSLLTGRLTITDVALHEGADIGNVLTAAASPPSSSGAVGGPLAGMRLDVRVVTTPGAQFRTTLTENLQADANATLLGTLNSPGMIGRVTVTEGDVVFFGNKYTINQGTITFSDANRINPILNVALGTTVQGIDVTITVNGPVDQMKLTYNSDPPLQFQQIVMLLAASSTPTTDPVLAAHSPVAPQQSLEQSGASAVLGTAIASPVAGRLQRLFGITRLGIDPQIVGTTNTAQTTLTIQQQINPQITFTYIEDVSQSNPEIIRAEWDISPHYMAMAERDINGEVIVDLFYKRRFH